MRYRKGPPSQTVDECQFSSTKLQKLENPFALCTLPGMQSPGALAVTLKSGGARAPPGYMAPAPLQLGASRIPLSAAHSQDIGTGKSSRTYRDSRSRDCNPTCKTTGHCSFRQWRGPIAHKLEKKIFNTKLQRRQRHIFRRGAPPLCSCTPGSVHSANF